MLPGDWTLAALALSLSIAGMFTGFSGSLAVAAGCAGAAVAAMFSWGVLDRYGWETWQHGGATLVISLLAFGLARMIVKKTVKGLLAQPADAIFGFLLGLVLSAAIAVVWALSGVGHEYSNIVAEVAKHVG